MNTKETLLNTCKHLVKNCGCQILIINSFGISRVFSVGYVKLKTRDTLYSEVKEAQDITNLVSGYNAHTMTKQAFKESTQSIPVENFCFATDDYLWMNSVSGK